MACIPEKQCPTLAEVDKILVKIASEEAPRPYLGFSLTGKDCRRAIWFEFHWTVEKQLKVNGIRAIQDGHRGESLMAERLSMVPGVELVTLDPETGRQFEFKDYGGHMAGHCDGKISGLKQAPVTVHIWEHKQVKQSEFNRLKKCSEKHGEKGALKYWEPTYYAQAQLYMHYAGCTRHFLTVATPGGRDYQSIRTDYDKAAVERYISKAIEVIHAERPLERISTDETDHRCGWCDFKEVCYGRAFANRNCRTCIHSTPEDNGTWTCALHGNEPVPIDWQRHGCGKHHRFIPELVPGELSHTEADGNGWYAMTYQMTDGSEWVDTGEAAQ